MLMLSPRPYILTILFPLTVLLACNSSKFRGGSDGRTSNPTTNKPNPSTEPPAQCKNGIEQKGIFVLYVIDNSASNGKSDCGIGDGQQEVTCPGPTKREQAVLKSFDALIGVDGDAVSKMAIVTFPSVSDKYNGADIQTPDWVDVTRENRSLVSNALRVTRTPKGMTPYGAGLEKAKDVMAQAAASDLKRLVILVSDGQPTDENVDIAKNNAAALRDQYQAEVITVMIDPSKTDAERQKLFRNHARILRDMGRSEANIADLIGHNGKGGLVEKVSSSVLSVSDAAGLTKQFESLVSKTSTCK